jgi:hypothetical protein
MRLHWLQHNVQARCPLCGVEGDKDAMLSTDHVLPGLRRRLPPGSDGARLRERHGRVRRSYFFIRNPTVTLR